MIRSHCPLTMSFEISKYWIFVSCIRLHLRWLDLITGIPVKVSIDSALPYWWPHSTSIDVQTSQVDQSFDRISAAIAVGVTIRSKHTRRRIVSKLWRPEAALPRLSKFKFAAKSPEQNDFKWISFWKVHFLNDAPFKEINWLRNTGVSLHHRPALVSSR